MRYTVQCIYSDVTCSVHVHKEFAGAAVINEKFFEMAVKQSQVNVSKGENDRVWE